MFCCKICNSESIRKIIDLGSQPLANKYPSTKKEIDFEKKYNLSIYFCKNCLSFQIKKKISPSLLFKDYYYLSSVNKALVDHFHKLSNKLKNSSFVVDIGSNDGIFLKFLKQKNINFIGVEPSINVGKIANNNNLTTLIGFFDSNVVKKIIKDYGHPDVVVCSSVFTHIQNPHKFIYNLSKLLKDDGLFILEIEYFPNFIKFTQFERFYFDRPFYYSVNSIKNLFAKYSLHIFDIEKINIHGGSIRCYIKKSFKVKETLRLKKILLNEKNILNLTSLKRFKLDILNKTNKLLTNLKHFKSKNYKVVGYGAPARVSTITNYTKINNNLIEYIIDDSFLKQNRYSPGQHIKIKSLKNADINNIDILIVFAYEYFHDIKHKIKNKNIKFYKPIPFKRLK